MIRLAVKLGRTPRELLGSVSSRELSELIAYDRIEPIEQPWRQTGVIAASIFRANPWSKGRKLDPEAFMPIAPPPPVIQPASQGLARLQMLAAALAVQKKKG